MRRTSSPEVVSAGRLLVVSPHFDDAAFSCAGLLERADPVDVLTVCGGRPDPPRTGEWDRWTGFADSDASVTARRREEAAAFEGSPHRLATLDLLPAQYLDGPRTSADAVALAQALREWAESGQGTVAIPAGAGWRRHFPWRRGPRQHPDHLFVRDVALDELGGRPDVDLLLYEELPYLWGSRADREAARIGRSLGRAVEPLELPVDRAAKAARIAAYETQVPHIYPDRGRLDDPHTLPLSERYWRLVPG